MLWGKFSRASSTIFITLFLCAALTGCARTIWVKPGTSQGDLEQIKAVCMVEGYNSVPEDNQTYLASEGRQVTTEKCRDKKKECRTETTFVPPQYGVRDNNDGIKNQVMRACMYRNGWQEILIER